MRALFTAFALFVMALSAFGQNPKPTPAPTPKPIETEVRIATKRDVAPGTKVRISLNTRNLPTVRLAIFKLDTIGWLKERERRHGGDGFKDGPAPTPLAPGKAARTWSVSMGNLNQKPTKEQPDVYRSKQINLPELPPGAYLLRATMGTSNDWTVVHITNLAVVVKRAPRMVLAWVTDHRSGNPVPGATVTLYGRLGEKAVVQGVTKADGVCTFPALPNSAQTLIVERGGKRERGDTQPDIAGMPLGNGDPDGRLISHIQTDRPVYRPGATVSYRAILRLTKGQGFTPISNAPVTVEVRDSRDTVIRRTQETTSALGTVSGEVPVPAQGALGAYTIVFTAAKQQSYTTFSVSEYRKPDFKVAVTADKARYLSGEKGVFKVQADYYFGAPLPNAGVRYTIRRNPNPYYGGSFDEEEGAQWFSGGDGNLYPSDTYAANEVIADGTVQTDKNGRAQIPFPTRGDAPDSTYSLTCTTTDGQRRTVDSGASVPVYAALLRLGIRTRLYSAPLNSIVPVDLRLADLDNKPAAGTVTLVTRQQIYDEKQKKNIWRELSHSQVTIPASGKAAAKVPAAKEGNVLVEATVTDSTGRKSTATTSIWVMDPDAKPEKEEQEPTVTLRLDRKTYKPGDTAQVYLSANTPTRPVLLTVEGAEIYAWTVAPRGKTNFLWKVPTTVAMSPNAYISASQWARPAYLIGGNSLLPVPDLTRRLDIKVSADRAAYRPGDQARYIVEAKDAGTGKPVSGAEVALAVVDESIFAVRPDTTPDPFGHFWGQRENYTQTVASAPEEVSGGAYQRNSPDGIAPVREKFLDTAFWNAHLITGPDGKVATTVDLPGNLTSWRATALAITDSTQAGRGVSNITVSRPMMLRLATPRQFVQGDHLTLIGTVSNRTDKERTVEVTLAPDGVTVEPGESATKTLRVPAKGEGKVEWRVVATSIPAATGSARIEGTLVVTNRAAGETLSDYSDRLRVSVPVRPPGSASRMVVGGPVRGGETTFTLDVPSDRLEPASTLTITVRGGAAQAAQNEARALYGVYGYGTEMAAARLQLMATPGAPTPSSQLVSDTLALLSRLQAGQGGWGWWEEAPMDSRLTADTLRALVALQKNPGILPASLPYPENLVKRGTLGGKLLYDQTGLWEDRAPLAVALAALDSKQYAPLLEEVYARNQGTLSPYASALLAESLAGNGKGDEARKLISGVLKIAVVGPESAYIPEGERPGWRASTLQTTAQVLETLITLNTEKALQEKLTSWLLDPSDGEDRLYATSTDRTAAVRALLRYARSVGVTSGTPPEEASVALTVNGTAVPWEKRAPGTASFAPLTARVPRELLKDGANAITLKPNSSRAGDLFALAELTAYRPQEAETAAGMRVLRRFETQTEFGTWKEVLPTDTIAPSTPVRVTVVVWPNETADALRVIEPLPSGFEYVDGEHYVYSRDEVRDGAIIHYLKVSGATPVTFRYYLRAESEGVLVALPATGELIRRPAIRGGSNVQKLTVKEEKP
ncbi:MAG: MG2 domain-containing protein [Armatimonas sp.]